MGQRVFFKGNKVRIEEVRDSPSIAYITLLEGSWEGISLWVGRKALKEKKNKRRNKDD